MCFCVFLFLCGTFLLQTSLPSNLSQSKLLNSNKVIESFPVQPSSSANLSESELLSIKQALDNAQNIQNQNAKKNMELYLEELQFLG